MYIDYNEVEEKYAAIIKKLLAERFGDEIVFDPIVVKADPLVCPDPDLPELIAYIVYAGDGSKLDSDFRFEFTEELWPHAIELGFPSVPVQTFVSKSNWVGFWPRLQQWMA